jgi:serine protease Do
MSTAGKACAAGAALLIGLAPLCAAAPDEVPEAVAAPAVQLGRAYAAVAAHVKPAVVSVYSEKMVTVQSPQLPFPFGDEFLRRFFGQQAPQGGEEGDSGTRRVPERGMGSGMILDSQGHILTNYHVVSGVDEIKVQLADGRGFGAQIVGTDPNTDVAVIRIVGPVPANLPTVELGDSDALHVGDLVLAIGAPFGLTQTVTTGIVSATGRSDVGIAAYEDFLQTDAPINPGNSGGPLVNMHGQVIGMTSAIATGGNVGQSAGVGFAIPSNMIKTMLPVLVRGGKIVRGMLGVGIQDLTPALAEAFHVRGTKGALVSQVTKDSPAAKAGLRPGDVIVRYDGKEVLDGNMLRNLVAATAPGTKVAVGVMRDGSERALEVTVGRQPTEAEARRPGPAERAADRLASLGLSVHALTPDVAQQLGLQGEKGVLVMAVEPGSPASEASLQPGDLIVEVNHAPVASVADLRRALGRGGNTVLLLIERQGASAYVILQSSK